MKDRQHSMAVLAFLFKSGNYAALAVTIRMFISYISPPLLLFSQCLINIQLNLSAFRTETVTQVPKLLAREKVSQSELHMPVYASHI